MSAERRQCVSNRSRRPDGAALFDIVWPIFCRFSAQSYELDEVTIQIYGDMAIAKTMERIEGIL